jgi:hypothetical protein
MLPVAMTGSWLVLEITAVEVRYASASDAEGS